MKKKVRAAAILHPWSLAAPQHLTLLSRDAGFRFRLSSPSAFGFLKGMFRELLVIRGEERFDGPMQMALDEVLLRDVTTPTMRVYRWSGHWVSFGYFQALSGVSEAFPGIPSVRRWTGGGTVEHGRDLTFSLMIPAGETAARMAPGAFYRELHGKLAAGLIPRVAKEIRLARESDRVDGPSCFAAPATDDLLLEGKKILGGAQRRIKEALLYQGSLQGLAELPGWETLGTSLSAKVTNSELSARHLEQAFLLSRNRYGSPAWTGRR